MKSNLHILLLLIILSIQLLLTGCQKESPSFLFWCIRPELVTKEIYVEKIDDSVEQSIDANFKEIDGFISSSWNPNRDILTITYKASKARYMNFERVLIQRKIEVQPSTE